MLEDDAIDVFSEVLEELEDGPGLGCTSPARSINAQSHASTVKVNKRFIPWMVNSQLQIYSFPGTMRLNMLFITRCEEELTFAFKCLLIEYE